MKCLSVCQPFADLIISGRKTIELRTWNTSFRGEFLIHAPSKIRTKDARRLRINEKFVTGAIIGKARLCDVKRYDSKKEFKHDSEFHFAGENFSSRMFGFMLDNPKPLNTPVPYKGKLGFFDVSGPKVRDREIISDIIDEECRYRLIGHH